MACIALTVSHFGGEGMVLWTVLFVSRNEANYLIKKKDYYPYKLS